VRFSPLVEVLQQVKAGELHSFVATAWCSALLQSIPATAEVIPGDEVAPWNRILDAAGAHQ